MKWISVKDKLPKYGIEVLVCIENNIDISTLHDNSHIDMPDNWYNTRGLESNPTHWMSLPENPKE